MFFFCGITRACQPPYSTNPMLSKGRAKADVGWHQWCGNSYLQLCELEQCERKSLGGKHNIQFGQGMRLIILGRMFWPQRHMIRYDIYRRVQLYSREIYSLYLACRSLLTRYIWHVVLTAISMNTRINKITVSYFEKDTCAQPLLNLATQIRCKNKVDLGGIWTLGVKTDEMQLCTYPGLLTILPDRRL